MNSKLKVTKASCVCALGLLCFAGISLAASREWVLQENTLTYHVSHPLHQSEGVSHAARGKGTCDAGQCDFLIAVPVKSFDSGDSNRDLHMLQVTKGAQYPLVTVRTKLPESALNSTEVHADLEVQFAGQTAQFKQVPFQLVTRGNHVRLTGTIPANVGDFKIDPPSLLSIAIKNEMPIRVELNWEGK